MRRILILPCLAVLAACNLSRTTPDDPPGTGGGSDAAERLTPVGSLALSVSQDRILFDGPCDGYGWDYQLEGKRLRISRTASPKPACLETARIHHVVFDLATAMDAATSAGRDSSNAVILSGGGHQITLYSQ